MAWYNFGKIITVYEVLVIVNQYAFVTQNV